MTGVQTCALPISFGSGDYYETFVPSAYRNRDDIRVPLFFAIRFYEGFPLSETEALRRAKQITESGFYSSALELSPIGRGGYFIDVIGGSMLYPATVFERGDYYPRINPARRYVP